MKGILRIMVKNLRGVAKQQAHRIIKKIIAEQGFRRDLQEKIELIDYTKSLVILKGFIWL